MKIMAIDYGDAHTGIAISDATGTLAGFSTVINSRRAETVAQEICALIPQHGVTELVLGYPKNMDGTVGPRAEKAAAFGQTLRQLTGLPVTLWDERRTTVDAHNILFNNGQNAKKRKKTVDAVAAALMLEGYLTRKRLEATAAATSPTKTPGRTGITERIRISAGSPWSSRSFRRRERWPFSGVWAWSPSRSPVAGCTL